MKVHTDFPWEFPSCINKYLGVCLLSFPPILVVPHVSGFLYVILILIITYYIPRRGEDGYWCH